MAYPYVQAFNDYGPRKGPIKAFVLHMAEGGGTVGFLSKPNVRGVSVHYVIEVTGRIVQMLPEGHASGSIDPTKLRTTDDAAVYGATVRHKVMGLWDHDPNSAVISVEIEGFASSGPNAAAHASLKVLIRDVRSRFPDMGLLGHRDFADYKACPGKLIHWDELGGHGPATTGGQPIMSIAYPPDPLAGTVTIPAGAKATQLRDGTTHTFVTALTVPAATVLYGDPAKAGYLLLLSGEPYLIGGLPFHATKPSGLIAKADAIAAVEAVK